MIDRGTVQTTDPVDLDDLTDHLRSAVLRFARVVRQQRADTSISQPQLQALAVVNVSGPLTPRDLAAKERVQPPTMTPVIATLEAHGLVTRSVHPTDGRQHLITITPAGKAFLAREREVRTRWLAGKLADLDPAERDLLSKVAVLLEEMVAE